MRRSLLILSFIVFTFSGFAGRWIDIHSPVSTPAKTALLQSAPDRSVVRVSLDGFELNEVTTSKGSSFVVSSGKMTPMLISGAPDLPGMAISLIIPDKAGMAVRVLSSEYKDYDNLNIAPSKGVLSRTVDPASVPYQYGKSYKTDAFFPGILTDTREPYILRDVRGQTLMIYPFQYNPFTKTLRVYYSLTVEMYKATEKGYNPLIRKSPEIRINREFEALYENHFLNKGIIDYTPLPEYGNMLVICYGPFMSAMQPLVKWKNQSGIPTEMIDVSTAGSTAAQIRSYIANYYNTRGLTFVLLVGDAPQIPTNTGSWLGGPSDNAYGYIAGNDHYADVFVGRFSAETIDQVQTQVQRTLDYEKNPQFLTDDWYTTVLGIGSDQGTGDDNEYDYQHIRNLQTQCMNYNYTSNPELFDGNQGGNDAPGNPVPGDVSAVVNEGSGLILYCGHGSETSWVTTGFSNSNINQLTNSGKLPFIWSVACVNGAFMNMTCFAESWLRAQKNGQPAGAVAFLGSTINQSWNSPMEGQDEMVSILVESYSNNIKRTFGGLSINGCMKMIDSYGTDGANMADTWTIFGDPSLLIRTSNPQIMTVAHDPFIYVGQGTLNVTCNIDGARATVSLHDTILATTLVSNHSAVLNFPPLQSPSDTVVLTVTGYNNYPYQDSIPVFSSNSPWVVYYDNQINDTTGNNNDFADYGEDILLAVTLKNEGLLSSSGIRATLRSSDPYISLNDTTEFYGVFQPGEAKKINDGYNFHLSNQVTDGHLIPFEMIAQDSSGTWTSGFSIQAHAPVLLNSNNIIRDSTGNNNGRLDPGETAYLKVFIENSGSSAALNVTGQIVSMNSHVTVTPFFQNYGNMNGGQISWHWFTVTVDTAAKNGEQASLLLEISADKGIAAANNINLTIGKIPVLIVDLDGNLSSGTFMETAVSGLGITSEFNTQAIPDSLEKYAAVFVCLGTYPDNHTLTNQEGTKLADYLNSGGRLYLEGGDTWYYDPSTPVRILFNINGTIDGNGDLSIVNGIPRTFTDSLSYSFSGDNQYIDHIDPVSPAYTVLKNQSPEYNTTIANDAGFYKTIGSSAEFGGLQDGIYPSTRQHLMEKYLSFFGIPVPSLKLNFTGFPTNIVPGGVCHFFDCSTGSIISRHWSFPGGIPDTSSEMNPVVTYNAPGNYDVRLVIESSSGTDTLIRNNYITVEYPTGISKNSDNSLLIFPNPGNGLFIIDGPFKGSEAKITVYNFSGQQVYSSSAAVRENLIHTAVDLSTFPEGAYFMKITGENSPVILKFVIEK
ncbi:MAG: C25 family cysteine peptidase [Bacteroidota bacterium]|nr:C25 family cysteine peptidase [Bacteroidota bacterium]